MSTIFFLNLLGIVKTCKESNKSYFTVFKSFTLCHLAIKISILIEGLNLRYIKIIVVKLKCHFEK